MKLIFLVLFILKSCISETNITAPIFTINMDLQASQRWEKPCQQFGKYVADIYANFLKLFPDEAVRMLEDIMMNWYLRNAYEPYRSEMEYFAKCSDVPLGGIVTINLIYDMTAWCTSIVASYSNGTILHGRNLDYGEMPLLRNTTFVAHYVNNNGDILYSGTTFFGYTGLWTAIKPNGFSISGDQRDNGTLVDNIINIHDDYYPPSWLMRDTVAQESSYADAKKRLMNTKLMASVYLILGGLNYPDGCVITRNSTYSYQLFELETSYLDWYVVETNYDWWTPPPKRDDRRDPAIASMNGMTQAGLTPDGLYNVLSTPPVMNDGTLYTTIMSASNPELYTAVVRYPDTQLKE